jgi:transcriptional regulator GlxA family with amidase domain
MFGSGEIRSEINRDAPDLWRVDIAISDGVVLTEMAAIVDVLRIANRLGAAPIFDWTFRSRDDGSVKSAGEAVFHTEPFPDKPDANYLLVPGNANPECDQLSYGSVIATYTHRGARVFLLAEAASRYITEDGSKNREVTTHWENTAILRERDHRFEAQDVIASEDGCVVTCAGMTSTFDVMFTVIGPHLPQVQLDRLADIFLLERVRDFGTRQIQRGSAATTASDKALDQCLQIMRECVEEPIGLATLAEQVGLSLRVLERRFKSQFGKTPVAYYRELRLSHANNLLLNTPLSIQEIGLACGFLSGFSLQFRRLFGVSPSELRRKRLEGAARGKFDRPSDAHRNRRAPG